MKTYTLRELREKKHLTQQETAKLVDVTKDYISMLERGERNPSDKMKERLAKVYGVEIYQIFLAIKRTKCSIEQSKTIK